jgi:hypothetical protein
MQFTSLFVYNVNGMPNLWGASYMGLNLRITIQILNWAANFKIPP